MSQTAREWSEWEDPDEDPIRECSNSCGHYDVINQCCWLVSNRGLFTEVQEGDTCRYGFKENSYE